MYAGDIDNDGDLDLLSASSNASSEIVWFENTDGQGGFGVQQIISANADGANCVYAIDMDEDGDIDVISSSHNDNKIVWYENTSILTMTQNSEINFSLYPNPTHDILNINSKISIAKFEVYNHLGQLILVSNEQNSIDISMLTQGIYFVTVLDVEGNYGIKKYSQNIKYVCQQRITKMACADG